MPERYAFSQRFLHYVSHETITVVFDTSLGEPRIDIPVTTIRRNVSCM